MTPEQTQEVLDQLAGIRRRVDELQHHSEAQCAAATVSRGLHELSAGSAAFPSVQALLFGAAELIERGEPAGHRLEKLSDHLHGYLVGWEDASQARGA